MNYTRILILALLILQRGVSSAQVAADSTDWEHTGNVSFGLSYLSDNVFLGRKDTIVTPYYTPSLAYTFKSGLYLRGEASYTTLRGGQFDAEALEAGYNFKDGPHWGGDLYLGKYFYNKASSAVRAEILWAFNAETYYNNDIITPRLSASLLLSQKTDLMLNPSLSHDFEIWDNRIELVPTVALNAGTQHYYDAYFKRINKLGPKKSDKVVLQADQFNIKDYEIMLQASSQIKHWEIELMPVYAIPVNPVTITLPTRTVSEALSNTFFVSLTLIYHLKVSGKR